MEPNKEPVSYEGEAPELREKEEPREIDVEENMQKVKKKWINLSPKAKKIVIICFIILASILIWYCGAITGAKTVMTDMLKNCACY